MDKQTQQVFAETKAYLWKVLGNERGVEAMAAWAMSTWIVGRFDRVLNLCLRQPINGTGTSTILHTVGSICMKPMYAAQMTDNAILHALNDGCTLLVDDYSFGNQQIDAILACGNSRRTSYMFKSVEGEEGIEIEKYRVYGMKLIFAHKPISGQPQIASKCLQITISKQGAGRLLAAIDNTEQTGIQAMLDDWATNYERRMLSHVEFINAILGGE